MKKVFNNIMRGFIALSVFAIGGCADTSIDSQPEAAANIQTDARESYDFTAISPMAVSFEVSANTPWRIESDAQWCTVTPSMSAASSLVETVTINVEENTEYSPREAVVTIMGTDIDFVRTVAIKQDSNADLIVLTPSAPVAAGGEDIEITVHSNKAWEYFALSDILQNAQNTSGDGSADAAIKIKVPANPGLNREGQFMIRTAIEERVYTILQDGMILRLGSSDTIDLGTFETEATILVESNIDWVAETKADWIKMEKVNDSTIKVSANGFNDKFVARKATIEIASAASIAGIEPLVVNLSQDVLYSWNAGTVNEETGAFYTEETAALTLKGDVAEGNYRGGALKKGHLRLEFSQATLSSGAYLCLNQNSYDAANTQAWIQVWLYAITGDTRFASNLNTGVHTRHDFPGQNANIPNISAVELFLEDGVGQDAATPLQWRLHLEYKDGTQFEDVIVNRRAIWNEGFPGFASVFSFSAKEEGDKLEISRVIFEYYE